MIYTRDYAHAHAAYLEGQRISRDKAIIGKVVFPAAFKAAITSVHMEMFYRDFYNDGQYWVQKCSKNKEWSEKIWMNYHMTLAGLSRYPNKGEYLKPVLDGHPILALNYSDFSALMANIKSFTQVKWQKLTTQDLIGPVKAFHQVTGVGNMAIAAQVPKESNGQNADVDQDYLFVFIIS